MCIEKAKPKKLVTGNISFSPEACKNLEKTIKKLTHQVVVNQLEPRLYWLFGLLARPT